MNHYNVVTANSQNNNQVPTLYLLKCLTCMLDTDQKWHWPARLDYFVSWMQQRLLVHAYVHRENVTATVQGLNMTRFPFPFSLMHKRTLTHQCCHKHRVTYYNRHFSPFQVSSCPLSHLGAPTLTLPASSLLWHVHTPHTSMVLLGNVC